MKIFSPVLKGTTTVSDGTTNLSGSFTGSLQGTATTASYVVASQTDTAQNTRLSTIESVTGSFATTASNAFNGSQTITGSLTATGTIVAQTLVVQTITSSVDFVSGSTRFGSTTGNEHQFTGSVLVSGSQIINGNVGIGTTNPGSKLDVAGGISLNGRPIIDNSSAELYIGGITGVSGKETNIVALYTANTERMRVTSGGNVGIGTTSPLAATGYTSISLNNASNGSILDLQTNGTSVARLGNNGTTVAFLETRTATPITISTNDTERIRILSGGNIGIGITNPSTKFQVSGDVALGGSLNSAWAVSVDNLGTTGANGLYVNIGASSTGVPFSVYKNFAALFQIANSGAATFSSSVTAGSGTDGSGYLIKGTDGTVFRVIDPTATGGISTVNFGAIGTSTGNVRVHATDVLFLSNGGSSERMRITSGGNVGIGITSPSKRLELSEDNSSTTSTTGLKITNFSGTTDTRAGIVFQNYDNNGAAIWGRRTGSTAGNLIFGTNPGAGTTAESAIVERMRIDNGGNVGIGVSSPSSKLHVVGSIYQSDASSQIASNAWSVYNGGSTTMQFNYNSDGAITYFASGVEKMRITGGGSVGIGVTNPSTTLDINGSVRYRGAIHDQFNYVASGNFTNGTYYDIVAVNQIQSGIYVLEGYIDTYAAGAGIYFMRFVSVPFYFWDAGSNSVTYSDFPAVLGTGHHLGNAFPLFRLQQTLGGAGIYLQFNPNASWSGMNNSSGKTFQVNLKRLGS